MSETIVETVKEAFSWIEKELGMSDQMNTTEGQAGDPNVTSPEMPAAPAPDATAAAGLLHAAVDRLASVHKAASDVISTATAEVQAAIADAEAAGLKVEHNLEALAGLVVTDADKFAVTIWQKL